jgi:hypothetical protein
MKKIKHRCGFDNRKGKGFQNAYQVTYEGYDVLDTPHKISKGRYMYIVGYLEPWCDCSCYYHNSREGKSWKNYRKHQWREK